MNRILQKRMWLAGASLLAIVLGSGDANAVVFSGPLGAAYTIPSTGYYDFTVAGANGGTLGFFTPGGNGAVVGGELFFDAGHTLDIVVGGGGGGGYEFIGDGSGGGGGGGSFVFGAGLLFAAGGGGGVGFSSSPGHPGIGSGGHPAGPASYGGGGGAGVQMGSPAPPAQDGSFPFGGAGASNGGPSGGYGGGGGGGYNGGGGGGGAPGGEGGGKPDYASGLAGGGGYSYVINSARNAFGITGGNMNGFNGNGDGANGYVSINFVAAPEPSTWAMTLTGFVGLGWLARLRKRKLTPA